MASSPVPDSGQVQLILQGEEPAASGGSSGRYACEGLAGLPVVNPCLILLHSCGSDEALQSLQSLRQGLAASLRAAGARPADSPWANWAATGPEAVAAGLADREGWHKLLVLVGDGKTPFRDPLPPWIQDWATNGPPCHVLPLLPTLPQGTVGAMKAEHLLPEPVGAINIQFWDGSIEHAVPTVLALAELTSDDWRIFVSYRRNDAQPLADQLFVALNEKNFDVFVDRFTLNPGVNFQQRLTEELAHKSMVLLLESATFHESAWTQHEVNFAKKHRLGILALRLPGGKKVADIDDAERIDLSADPTTSFDGYTDPQNLGKLRPKVLDEVVRRVRREHGLSLLRRRQYIRDAMRDALLTQGLAAQAVGPDGLLKVVVKPRSAAGGRAYALWLTTRPPVLADFHYTHVRRGADGTGSSSPEPDAELNADTGIGESTAVAATGSGPPSDAGIVAKAAMVAVAQPPGQTAVVIGPSAFLSTDVRDGLNWLADISRIRYYDESSIFDVARDIARGLL